jgi:hypothetical protein
MYNATPSPHSSPSTRREQFSNRNKYVFINTNTLLFGASRKWQGYPRATLFEDGGHPETTGIRNLEIPFNICKAKKVIQKEGFFFCPKSKADQTWWIDSGVKRPFASCFEASTSIISLKRGSFLMNLNWESVSRDFKIR